MGGDESSRFRPGCVEWSGDNLKVVTRFLTPHSQPPAGSLRMLVLGLRGGVSERRRRQSVKNSVTIGAVRE